ncbi:hypothetical protein KAR91_67415 [Candidatus Pacearchaeota archaeon]|nr:hypothetical protein [Candidatus Pacearchaeota archaeon]
MELVNINTIRLFIRTVRWYSIIFHGSVNTTFIRIGVIGNESIPWLVDTDKFVKVAKKSGDRGDAADYMEYLLVGLAEYMSEALKSALESIEADNPGECAVYLDRGDPGRDKLEFREFTEVSG